jgi:hypothetical protein
VREISSIINNEIVKHLPGMTHHLMARQTEGKEGFKMQFLKKEVVDVVVLSSLKTVRAAISL